MKAFPAVLILAGLASAAFGIGALGWPAVAILIGAVLIVVGGALS